MRPLSISPDLIGFDIDGVVADTAEAFLRIAAEEYGPHGFSPEDIVDFDVENCIAMDAAKVHALFSRLMDDPLSEKLKPMPYAKVVLEELAKKAPLTFITARPHYKPIEEWLQHLLSPEAFKTTQLIAMGEHDGKIGYIKEMGLRFFIDDRAETCNSIYKEGLTPIVFNQPWNRGKHNLHSVDNWQAIWQLCFDH